MKTIVKFAVFVAILYVAYQYGKPHLDRLTGTLGLGDLGGGGSEAGHCIAVAEQTTETFTDMVARRAQPPIDLSRWAGSYRLAEGRLRDAQLACECEGEACEMGKEALGMLADYMRDWDNGMRNKKPVLNGARVLERIYGQLGRAKAKAH